MPGRGRVFKRRPRHGIRWDAAQTYGDVDDCFHRWSVFVAGKDGRRWGYCVRCGALRRWSGR